jgi:hypothetical protein
MTFGTQLEQMKNLLLSKTVSEHQINHRPFPIEGVINKKTLWSWCKALVLGWCILVTGDPLQL